MSETESIQERENINCAIKLLDPNGDRWQVSSKVLSLASPVFAALFQPHFREGALIRTSASPEVPLHGDDPIMLGVILEILHYREPQGAIYLDPKELATLAIHCNKYDCTEALRPWSTHWFIHLQKISTSEEYGFALLAAHLLRDERQFSGLSVKALATLTLNFPAQWEATGTLSLLPTVIQDNLLVEIEDILTQLHGEVQSVEGYLRTHQTGYSTHGLVCMSCGRTLPAAAKKCHPCKNIELHPKFCTSENRVAEYFGALRATSLWPSLEPFQKCSASVLATRVANARSSLRHSCAAGKICPLELGLEMLITSIQQILDGVEGLPLYPVHPCSACDE
ncbi:hypothetical protein BDW59DRAFT_172896 [Aspergillus cavernicola]|uniref:BTB domain-containing protein n=1 Tax=Aspergillus cavernicola TaxID=176166 RepID=A0ABR4I9G0_9EURO